MTGNPAKLDLRSDGVRELIQLTNDQFGYWAASLRRETNEDVPAGNLLDYWFIMSQLALCGPDFRMNKKDAYTSIPNLKPETVRKHVASAGRLGFVDTVKSRGMVYLRLTTEGQKAIESTLGRWVLEFGRIQRKHFDEW